jgi:hypothetical protein
MEMCPRAIASPMRAISSLPALEDLFPSRHKSAPKNNHILLFLPASKIRPKKSHLTILPASKIQ